MSLPKSLTFSLFVLAGVLLNVTTANASISLSINASKPTEDLLVGYTVGYDNFAWTLTWTDDSRNGHRDCAQSFLVTGDYDWIVDKISVKVRGFGASIANQAYALQIWTVSNPSDISGDTLVSNQSGVFPSSGLTGGFWTFDISNVSLTAGQYYTFVLGFASGPSADLSISLIDAYSALDRYPNGRLFYRVGTPQEWAFVGNSSNRDFEFYIQGSPVPEPAALAMWALGLVGLPYATWRRKQRR